MSKIYTKADWTGDFGDCIPAGARIDEELYDHFLNVLPPRNWDDGYFQVPEALTSATDSETGKYRNLYSTFDVINGQCVYVGACFSKGHKHIDYKLQ
jgi:hypothetical protein